MLVMLGIGFGFLSSILLNLNLKKVPATKRKYVRTLGFIIFVGIFIGMAGIFFPKWASSGVALVMSILVTILLLPVTFYIVYKMRKDETQVGEFEKN